jgi:tRNA(fMet)-specific endonuclease VapC
VTSLFLLDTNIVSDLVRHPQGPAAARVSEVGEHRIATSIIVAAELRYGASKKGSARLTDQLEAILGVLEVIPFQAPADTVYGEVRARLERQGELIGANDLLIASQALALDRVLVTDNTREFARVSDLTLENWLR